jgi:hypothetical protein
MKTKESMVKISEISSEDLKDNYDQDFRNPYRSDSKKLNIPFQHTEM